jgi:hypothetical protein
LLSSTSYIGGAPSIPLASRSISSPILTGLRPYLMSRSTLFHNLPRLVLDLVSLSILSRSIHCPAPERPKPFSFLFPVSPPDCLTNTCVTHLIEGSLSPDLRSAATASPCRFHVITALLSSPTAPMILMVLLTPRTPQDGPIW